MDSSITDLLLAFAIAGAAGFGGALIVYGEFDDSPGGMLLGLLIIIAAGFTGWKALRARRDRVEKPTAEV